MELQPDIPPPVGGFVRVQIKLSIDSLANPSFDNFDTYFAVRECTGSRYRIVETDNGMMIADARVTKKQFVELQKKQYVNSIKPYSFDEKPLHARQRLFTQYS